MTKLIIHTSTFVIVEHSPRMQYPIYILLLEYILEYNHAHVYIQIKRGIKLTFDKSNLKIYPRKYRYFQRLIGIYTKRFTHLKSISARQFQ